MSAGPTQLDAIVVGGGISGIASVIRLRRELGLENVVLIEKSAGLGGTWNDNTYPGCACDIPSALYSFEFAPNPDWSRMFATQPEILAYVRKVADDHRVTERSLLNTEVTSARWDQESQRWDVTTTNGSFSAPILIFGIGMLNEPVLPEVPGVESFEGAQFHSARWNHDHDLTGRRVAVIGSAATAIQVVPSIQPQVAELVYLQRTPGWVMPKPDWPTSRLERRLFRRFPVVQRLVRAVQFVGDDAVMQFFLRVRLAWMLTALGRLHLRLAVRDPELRRVLTPDYALGCKRFMVSNTYYRALSRPNVTLVPHGLREVRPHSIVATDGSEHEVDTIIWATGFNTFDPPFLSRVFGRDGRTITETWGDNPRAYLGTSISGFPNAYMMWGPNAGTGCNFVMVEAQLNYAIAALRTRRELGATSIDIRPDVVDTWKDEMRAVHRKSTFGAGGCVTWYRDPSGDVSGVYGGTMRSLLKRSRRAEPEMFQAELPQRETTTYSSTG